LLEVGLVHQKALKTIQFTGIKRELNGNGDTFRPIKPRKYISKRLKIPLRNPILSNSPSSFDIFLHVRHTIRT